jgi:general secretion pathway protein C
LRNFFKRVFHVNTQRLLKIDVERVSVHPFAPVLGLVMLGGKYNTMQVHLNVLFLGEGMRRFAQMGWSTGLGMEAALRVGQVLCWCASLALLTWVVMQWMVPAPSLAPALPEQASNKFQMDQSAEARLLGVERAGGVTPPSVKVLGIFADAHGRGAAVLSVEGQASVSKSVGDEVANGWTLFQVEATRVVLDRQGLRHSVDLPIQRADPNMLVRVPSEAPASR